MIRVRAVLAYFDPETPVDDETWRRIDEGLEPWAFLAALLAVPPAVTAAAIAWVAVRP